MHKLRVSLIAICVALILMAAVGFWYDRVATARDKAQHPMQGQLVDLGGFRLHLYCTGAGKPTVVKFVPMTGLGWAGATQVLDRKRARRLLQSYMKP
jgi:hypothetical protein